MRRTAVLAIFSVASLALLTPAAHAADADTRLTTTSTCQGGGHIRMASRLDAAGTAHVHVRLWNLSAGTWTDQLMLDSDDATPFGDPTSNDLVSMGQTRVREHGSITGAGDKLHAESANALALWASREGGACMAEILVEGEDRFVAVGTGAAIGVNAANGTLRGFASAERNHRYRLTFTATTKAGTRRWSLVRKATGKSGEELDVKIRHVKHLASFTKASVTVSDLTKHADPVEVQLAR